MDGDGYLDLYANHHGRRGTEIIYNFATDAPRSVELFVGGDKHGVTFFDIDQDGDADLLQAMGGDRGSVTDPADPARWNIVQLNDGGVIDSANSVGLFGIEYGPGRGRILTPVNFDGQLAIYAGVQNDREDGSYPGEFFRRTDGGAYEAFAPLGDAVSGELAKGVHFGDDPFVDIINLDWKKRELWVHENEGAGFEPGVRLSGGGSLIYDVLTGDFDGDLQAEVLVARSGRRERLYEPNEAGVWGEVNATSMILRDTNTVALAAGDFDNDGDLDYAALQHGDAIDLRVYLNRGDGTFEEGWRVFEPSVLGQSEFMYSGDFDRDGALDLIVSTSYPSSAGSVDGQYVVLSGQLTENNWLSVELRGVASETGGLGARVYVTTADGEVRMREQDSGVHFNSQNAKDLHFGLGDADTASVRIVWPDDSMQVFVDVTANQHLVLTERPRPNFDLIIEGSVRNDDLRGSTRDDLILGGEGFDLLEGRLGDDALYGGRGNDHLFAGPGADLLAGGPGSDRLTGRAGADTFRFGSHLDTRPGARDMIRDFEGGVDVIDLSPIDANLGVQGDQRFVFIGGAEFTGLARQLRFAAGLLEGDIDADGVAEFQIAVPGVTALSSDDFIL